MSHSDACTERDLSSWLDSVEFRQDPASIWCQRGQDLTVTVQKDKDKAVRKHTPSATVYNYLVGKLINNHVTDWIFLN